MGYTTEREGLEELFQEPEEGRRVGVVHLEMVREARYLYGPERVTDPGLAAGLVRPLFAMADREMVVVMGLTAQLEPISIEVAAVGGLDACTVDVRSISKHALLGNAACIMCFHNHPSGSTRPSREDGAVTRRMQEAGRILGIRLVDHIIIGGEGYRSLREDGLVGTGPEGVDVG